VKIATSLLLLAFWLSTSPAAAKEFPWPGGKESERIALVSLREANSFNERSLFLTTDGGGVNDSLGIYPWLAIGGFWVKLL